MPAIHDQLAIPHADQFVGVWAIREQNLSAMISQVQNLNLQVHLEQARDPEAQAAIEKQARTSYAVTSDRVATIELHGSLTKHASSFGGSRSMAAARRSIRAAVKDPDVSAILLHIDSPGGTVAGTTDLADDIAAAARQKPVHAYIEDLGASAAYWLASQATKVYANRSAEVGSIGVFMAITDWSAYAEKEGAKVHVVRFGDHKGAGIPGTEITAEQLAEWQKQVDAYGAMFIDAVAAGRGMAKAQAKQLADGRMHTAADAVDLKLIDGVKTLDEVHAELAAATRTNPGRTKGAKAMSDQTNEPQGPKAATLAELKAAMPEATSDFLLAQLEAGATEGDALKAYNAHLAEQLKEQAEAREAAEKKAAEAAAKIGQQQPAPRRGNAPSGTADAEDTEIDFHAEVKQLMREENIGRREAMYRIKKRHAEAREAFKVGKGLPG